MIPTEQIISGRNLIYHEYDVRRGLLKTTIRNKLDFLNAQHFRFEKNELLYHWKRHQFLPLTINCEKEDVSIFEDINSEEVQEVYKDHVLYEIQRIAGSIVVAKSNAKDIKPSEMEKCDISAFFLNKLVINKEQGEKLVKLAETDKAFISNLEKYKNVSPRLMKFFTKIFEDTLLSTEQKEDKKKQALEDAGADVSPQPEAEDSSSDDLKIDQTGTVVESENEESSPPNEIAEVQNTVVSATENKAEVEIASPKESPKIEIAKQVNNDSDRHEERSSCCSRFFGWWKNLFLSIARFFKLT